MTKYKVIMWVAWVLALLFILADFGVWYFYETGQVPDSTVVAILKNVAGPSGILLLLAGDHYRRKIKKSQASPNAPL